LENVDVFYGNLEYFKDIYMTIWYIFSVLVSRTKKNLATLLRPISKNGLEGLSPEEDLREN
jgi:hypothetical protein